MQEREEWGYGQTSWEFNAPCIASFNEKSTKADEKVLEVTTSGRAWNSKIS